MTLSLNKEQASKCIYYFFSVYYILTGYEVSFLSDSSCLCSGEPNSSGQVLFQHSNVLVFEFENQDGSRDYLEYLETADW